MRAFVALAVLLSGGAASAQVEPFRSHTSLSFSNGISPAFYDLEARRVVSWREHLYAARDPQTFTRELAYDVYFGVRAAGENRWLTDVPIDEAGYDGQSGIARVVQRFGDVVVTQYFFSPFGPDYGDRPALICVAEVENAGAAPLSDAALFSLENLHVGGGASGTSGERITWSGDAFEERGPVGLVLHRAVPAADVHGATPENPWQRVSAGMRLAAVEDSGVTDDAVAGFEWDLGGLEPGETRRFAVVLGFDAAGDRAAAGGALPDSAGALLDAARADWAAYQAAAAEPAGLSDDERAVYRRALAVLRMAQVREPAPAGGQIVASLPPGMWNIAWVRDQAYAADALIDAGLLDAARNALRFVLEADAGHYVCCDAGGGPYVGTEYAISVTRYYGGGLEESDANANGPNIEFDGFGLTLRSLAAYVAASGDTRFVEDHAGAIFERTADVLLSLVEPETGLIRADSSIWETHWENGARRHHTYTQASAASGLRAAAALAEATGRDEAAARYRQAASALAAAIADQLVDPATGVLRSSLEETQSYLDGAVVEAFNWDVLPASGEVAGATLDALRAGLWNEAVGRGYKRNDNGDAYDEREWVVVDLRIAEAARRAGRSDHAAALIDWITGQARANFDLIPENFDRQSGAFAGEVPMAGFGAGAYVTALWQRAGGAVDPGEPDEPETPGDGPGGAAPAGCGCRSANGGGGWLILFAVPLAFIRRRTCAASSTASSG